MVAGRDWPHGDPYLQRQNEPSLAVSTRNPLHILALANDYRSVDIPFDSPVGVDSEERGDAWLGVFKSRNGGQTWWSDLLDGYPQQANSTSAIHGFQAAADAVVRSGPNGMFYASGIVLNRTAMNPLGAVFVTRFIDDNRTENGDPFVALGSTVVDRGTSGQFLDKPWIAVGPGTSGAKCTVNGEIIDAQNVYIAYTTFVGNDNNIRTKLLFARSTDCGATWSAPTKLSEGFPVNQGATIVVSPTGPIYVVWRLFKTATTGDAIMIAKSTDNGATFSKASTVRSILPFEQGTVALPNQPAIRTNAYPAAAVDSTGRVYVVWADRITPSSDGRILMMHSADGVSWTGPITVDPQLGRGNQFMPTITVAGGRIVVGYYDLRDDSTRGIFQNIGGGAYSETRENVGDRITNPSLVFSPFLQEYLNEKRRHTLDLRGTLMTVSAMGPVINGTTRLSQYVFGSRPESKLVEQLQFNPPNLPMFRLGTAPFLGDYIDVTSYAAKAPVYHFAWTDNRDVRPPLDGNWANYTPVFSPSNNTTLNALGSSRFANQSVPQCIAGQTGMRNQNIYTARVTSGVFAGAPGNSKPLGTIQRAFAVFVQNSTGQQKSFRLSATASSGVASFDQSNAGVPSIDVPVTQHASATRTVYVTSQDHHATVNVDIVEIDTNGNVVAGGLTTAVVLNPDVSNPDVSNPDVSNPDVSNPDVSNPDVSNPDVSNAEVHTPDVSNPDVSNPDVSNPDVSNPDVSNPDVSNPDVSNPDVSNPDVSNPDVSNPDVSNPAVSNSALGDTTDYTWTTHNKGNTTGGYTVKLAANAPVPDGLATQLIVHRVYQTPIATSDCKLGQQKHSQILSNVINPNFVTINDVLTLDPNDASFYLAPGDAARITLRVYAPASVFNPKTAVAAAVVAQAKDNRNGVIAAAPAVALPSSLPLFIATKTVNDAVANQPYTTKFSAIGGTPPYSWVANVPEGATFSGSDFNVPNGFPSSGKTVISVSVTDAVGTRATARYGVVIYDQLQITTDAPPNGQPNQPYSTPIEATGGKAPYTWSKYKPESFPTWLSLDSNTGQLTGTPTVAGGYDVNVQVNDAANPPQTAVRQFHIFVSSPLNVTFTQGPATTTAGQSQTVLVTVKDATGAVLPGVNVNLTIGNNPGGDTLNLSALTNAVGVATFQVTLNNPGAGYTLIASATSGGFTPTSLTSGFFTIQAAPLAILNTSPLPDAYQGAGYSVPLKAQGGTPPYTWRVTSGALPRGMDTNSTPAIIGSPVSVTFTTLDFTVTDSGSPQQTASKKFALQTWAPQSDYCASSGTFPLFNNTNTSVVQTGALSPSIVAQGRPNGYTLKSIATYHSFAAYLLQPTLGLLDAAGKPVGTGPWGVFLVPASSGFQNFQVDQVPNSPVLNGTYGVFDGDTSTWAFNEGSAAGFTQVCVTPNP